MKVGDLVRCTWQPKVAGVDQKTQACLPMKHTIEGEVDIIESVCSEEYPRYFIVFPQLGGYSHRLAPSAFEVISESR